MGTTRKLLKLSKEYMKSPDKQFYKYLQKILNIGIKQGVSKEKIKKFVDDWAKNG